MRLQSADTGAIAPWCEIMMPAASCPSGLRVAGLIGGALLGVALQGYEDWTG